MPAAPPYTIQGPMRPRRRAWRSAGRHRPPCLTNIVRRTGPTGTTAFRRIWPRTFYGVEDFIAGYSEPDPDGRLRLRAAWRRAGMLAAPRAVPHRSRHAVMGQAGRQRHRRRLLRALNRGGARHQPPQRRPRSLRPGRRPRCRPTPRRRSDGSTRTPAVLDASA